MGVTRPAARQLIDCETGGNQYHLDAGAVLPGNKEDGIVGQGR
jgi:hypothetical protein